MKKFVKIIQNNWIIPASLLVNFSLFMTPRLTIYGFILFFYSLGYFSSDQINKYKLRKKVNVSQKKLTSYAKSKSKPRRPTTKKSLL